MIEALIGAATAAILTLGAAIYSYARLTKTVEAIEEKVDNVELQMMNHVAHHLERLEPDINDIKTDVAVIKAREE